MTIQQLPYIHRTVETALNVGDTLIVPAPARLPDTLQNQGIARQEKIEQILFAYRIPYLPDLLMSPYLSRKTEYERLVEILEHQVRLIGSLSRWRGVAFALRYLAWPERGEVELTLTVRTATRLGEGQCLGEEIASAVATLLRSFNFPIEPIADVEELNNILDPFPQPMIVEIRQHEEVISMLRGDAYVVYPFRPSTSTWIPLLETLLRQRNPCLINIYLEPTRLYEQEKQLFTQASILAESLSDFNFTGLVYQGRWADPQAKMVDRAYTNYLQRLINPFLFVIQVASPDPVAVQAVAQALGTEMTGHSSVTETVQEDSHLPTGFDLIVPQDTTDLAAAYHTLQNLDLIPWGKTKASSGKERLRYLVDAYTARAAFRFPVAVRGGIPGIKTRQPLPNYEVGSQEATVAPGEIGLGIFADRDGSAGVPINSFNCHTLVTGTTGSGKTTTCIHLLTQLWEQGIPFLVIEPAKSEYRSLLNSPLGKELQVFTLGDEEVSPFRLNPLELLPGVRLETHISYLRTCLEAALPTFGVLPSLIEQSLYKVYLDKDWVLTDKGQVNDQRLMPTLGDLYFEIIRVTEGRGHSDKTLQDIRAAAAGRIGSLLRGSKGRMLNTRWSIPMETLMTRPTVLELEFLNDEEKTLVMLFLLTMIREYCRSTRTETKLQHVTLIEEAHRVMAATSQATNREVSTDTRAEAISMFSTALSEIRAFGEGLIIAEQIPSRLAEDALKNTNIKIIHRLLGQDDRETVGGTMNMGEEQQTYLTKLVAGQAALFTENYEKPAFITVPDYRSQHQLTERVSDEQVKIHMASFRERYNSLLLPFSGCQHCQQVCHYRDQVVPVAYELESNQRFRQAIRTFETSHQEGNEAAGWIVLLNTCRDATASIGLNGNEHAAYCYLTHLWNSEFTEAMAKQFYEMIDQEGASKIDLSVRLFLRGN